MTEVRTETASRLAILLADPELAEGVPAEERHRASQLVGVEARRLEAGPWRPERQFPAGASLLVLSGLLTRGTTLGTRPSTQLIGPRDVVRVGVHVGDSVEHGTTWTVEQSAVVAVLDDRFALAARRWPSLNAVIQDRLLDQLDRLTLHLAISQLPRVEERIHAMLRHIADRWGRVTPRGVELPLRLTHEALGRLVGAQRPTVTLALAALEESGRIMRRAGGGWLLLEPAAVEEPASLGALPISA